MEPGFCEGDTCNRAGCQGVIHTLPVENCSCHICPPCSACTSPRSFCPVCGWEEANEPPPPVEASVHRDYPMPVYKSHYQRVAELVPDKIRWVGATHTHFTMIKEGVYPEGTTIEQVREEVKGTFGGRFGNFGGGKFKYIAYTD